MRFNAVFEIEAHSIPEGSTIHVENIHTREQNEVLIEEQGRGRFSINSGAIVQVSTQLGNNRYIFQLVTIDKPIYYQPLDIANAELLTKHSTTSSEILDLSSSNVSTFSLPQDFFRELNMGVSSQTNGASYISYIKFGLPSRVNLIRKKGYVLSYNQVLKIPAWTAYWFSGVKKDIDRSDRFTRDSSISAVIQSRNEDYRGSGFHRGHMVSSGDMKYLGIEEVRDANTMTAILPQTPIVNTKTWLSLEKFGRIHARDGVGIIAGPLFIGESDRVELITIGKSNVAVPTHLFRIIYRYSDDGKIEALSFIVPNSSGVGKEIHEYLVSIDRIEELSGLDFFNEMTESDETRLERFVAKSLWEIN